MLTSVSDESDYDQHKSFQVRQKLLFLRHFMEHLLLFDLFYARVLYEIFDKNDSPSYSCPVIMFNLLALKLIIIETTGLWRLI